MSQCSAVARPLGAVCAAHQSVDVCVALAAGWAGVAGAALLASGRGHQKLADARHLAVYLAHTACGLGFSELAPLFARDRATLRHACAKIEDRRDEPLFDAQVTLLERALAAHSIAAAASRSKYRTGDRNS